ncbi:MAG: prenyltransferase [Bacteroidetes bacterium ADurb.Bin408]|nr:MAG: prenyltransferase [Bacteroidetes bacterium ADurb.Bin408]
MYLFFAFLTSFIREIVKDIEDIEGDRRVGCETIPIKLGIPKAKKVIYSMIGLMLLFLGLMTTIVFLKPHYNLLGFYLAFLILLFAYMLSLVIKAKEKQDYSFLSMYIKIVMLAGIFTMQLVYILLR